MADQAYTDQLSMATRFPALVSHTAHWKTMKGHIKAGNVDKAVAHAKAVLAKSPRLYVRNTVALQQKKYRQEYLRWQIDLEKDVDALFKDFGDRAESLITNAGGSDGAIPRWKTKPLLDRLKKLHTQLFADLRVLIAGGVRDAVKMGIIHTMNAAQVGLDTAKKKLAAKEFEMSESWISGVYEENLDRQLRIIEADKKATMSQASQIFQDIYGNVKDRRIKKGLFKNYSRGDTSTQGVSLSQRVWDLRDQNFRNLRVTVADGIASGRSSSSIAQDIQKYSRVGMGKPRVRVPYSQPGVYNTAYKNALRLTRSETNNAYHEASVEYNDQKGYQMMWNVSVGKREPDECDDLDGKIYDPQDYPPLPHPNCSCYSTTVIPDVG